MSAYYPTQREIEDLENRQKERVRSVPENPVGFDAQKLAV